MIILIIRTILSDHQIIIVHIIILFDLVDIIRSDQIIIVHDHDDFAVKDGNDVDDYLATSSPLMERIWSPGMSLSTLGPPPVTNLKKGECRRSLLWWYIAVPVSLLICY